MKTDHITELQKPDGRRLRSDRSRQLIIESMLQLIREGNLVPTAQQVADHAKVGIRSVFRHFEDMESIYETANKLCEKDFEGLYHKEVCDGDICARIMHIARQHASVYEAMGNIMLSTRTRLWHSPTLQKNYTKHQMGFRQGLEDWLPELKALSSQQREAVEAVASFDFWHRLRGHQSQTIEASIDLIVAMLKLLIQK